MKNTIAQSYISNVSGIANDKRLLVKVEQVYIFNDSSVAIVDNGHIDCGYYDYRDGKIYLGLLNGCCGGI